MQLRNLPEEFIQEMVDRLVDGCGPTTLCDSMQIPRSVYYNWMKEGEKKDNEPFTSFAKRIQAAKGAFLYSCVKEIKQAGRKQWQANAWLLERKDPEHYSEKYRCKEYPQHLLEMPFERQGNEIFKMMLGGEISQHEAHMFIEILANKAKVEENIELKRQLFEIKEKQK